MKCLTSPATLVAATLLFALTPARAGHVYGGIIDTDGTPGLGTGDALSFVNATTGVAVTNLSATTALVSTTGNPQFGLYRSTAPTFTALPATGLAWEDSGYIAANAYAATPGSFLEVRIDSVTGPDGAQFSFWDAGSISPTSTYTIGTGLVLGTGIWSLTNDGTSYPDDPVFVGDGITPNPTTPNGNPATDPYGHIHGRSFTVDQPGQYTVSYILHDAAGHHPDSAPFLVTYSAVPEPGLVALLGLGTLGGSLLIRRRRTNRAS